MMVRMGLVDFVQIIVEDLILVRNLLKNETRIGNRLF